jgi:hypothetical protein
MEDYREPVGLEDKLQYHIECKRETSHPLL